MIADSFRFQQLTNADLETAKQSGMSTPEIVKSIFSLLHDGCFSEWTVDNYVMTLTIECQYLAERIDKSFDRFYVELGQVDAMTLTTWPNHTDIPTRILSEPYEIFKAELEILSAEIENEKVVVSCYQGDSNFDYRGGNLSLSCGSIKIFDQNKRELTIEQFGKLANEYWDEWSRK